MSYPLRLIMPIGRRAYAVQALHHFVVRSDWSDAAVLERVRQCVSSRMDLKGAVYWIVDDTCFRKKGRHSVGVARQCCGEIGKQDNWGMSSPYQGVYGESDQNTKSG